MDANSQNQVSPFKVQFNAEAKQGFIKKAIAGGLEKTLGLSKLQTIYANLQKTENPLQFINAVLDVFNITCQIENRDNLILPNNGPVIVVANHPFGGIEGLLLAKLILESRPDCKIMANNLLERIPELKDLFFFVDPFGTEDSKKKNLSGMKATVKWLSEGHTLGVFPSGEVASFDPKSGGIDEPGWNPNIAKLAKASKATVIPVHFSGSNTISFHMAGLIHPRLRTALLGHQFINKRDQTIRVQVGNPIRFREYAPIDEPKEIINYFEARTHLLERHQKVYERKASKKKFHPLARPSRIDAMQSEIESLQDYNYLISHGDQQVYIANDSQIPSIMREIGRLREMSFRIVGEGTGKERDTDEYDHFYKHLFIWDSKRKQVVGAYRLAEIDSVRRIFSKKGLYTHSLFKFGKEFLDEVHPGIELGRSFVHPDYQRSFQPLLLLWKGICKYVTLNPNYRYLMGAVSISRDYSNFSKKLLINYLEKNHWNKDWAQNVIPRNPFKKKKNKFLKKYKNIISTLNLDQINAFLKEINPDLGGMPILLKQYLRMDGQLVGFNIDHNFSDVVDGLIIVDLLKSNPDNLKRYMGDEEYDGYISYHIKSDTDVDDSLIEVAEAS